MNRRALGAIAAGGSALAAWGLFESQWLQTSKRDVPVNGLPPALDGLSILHLSDFHAGTPSLNMRTLQKAVSFGVQEQPDIVAITGDIVAHPRGEAGVVEQLARLAPPFGMYAALGNHDTGQTRDPFSRGRIVEDWGAAPVTLLRDRTMTVEANGHVIEIAGLEPDPWLEGVSRPGDLFTVEGSFRILLAHFPDVVDDLPAGECSLMLAGHLHGGQICVPTLGGKVRLSHTEWKYLEGVHRIGDTTLVVSRGTGTTLLPFRLLARPEVSLLRLVATSA
ncbi:MAG TPA: metallophosphoesterase [Gaiellales bacterium]|jgi:predicted MPP superfamily phosphohydrolase|nr:metallophosphoesterase [Gaiellales bacterium]